MQDRVEGLSRELKLHLKYIWFSPSRGVKGM